MNPHRIGKQFFAWQLSLRKLGVRTRQWREHALVAVEEGETREVTGEGGDVSLHCKRIVSMWERLASPSSG